MTSATYKVTGMTCEHCNHQHRFHTLVSHVRGPADPVTFGRCPITSAIPAGVGPGGNKTGQRYETVAMVLRYDADAHEAVICAAWGPDTDWIRNLRAGPAAQVRLGRESFTPQHRFLSDDEAFDVAVQFSREHPRRLRLISTILGWGELGNDAAVRGFVHTHPFVVFRPVTTSPA
jgi:deazaflavin-dependent oxidoreductase (nitroreductase family)